MISHHSPFFPHLQDQQVVNEVNVSGIASDSQPINRTESHLVNYSIDFDKLHIKMDVNQLTARMTYKII